MRAYVATTIVVSFVATTACAKPHATPVTDSASAAPVTSTASGAPGVSGASLDTASIQKTIADADAKWAAAEQRGDVNAIAPFYAENVVTMYDGMPTERGRDAAVSGLKDNLSKSQPDSVAFHTDDLIASGDFAMETGTSRTVSMKNGKKVIHNGRYMTLWQKQSDGTWKVRRDIEGAPADTTRKAATM